MPVAPASPRDISARRPAHAAAMHYDDARRRIRRPVQVMTTDVEPSQ